MIREELNGDVPFQPRARLLKLIGAELISDDVVAVTELVKNAHDADATHVTLTFRGASQEDGMLVITDDGSGMDRKTLLERWMQPAGSEKREPGSRRTPRGRRMLGEKGVGRFASDKLASKLELISRKIDQDIEIQAYFDWDRFDAADTLLSEVRSRWEVRPADTIRRHGTVLRLSGLRSVWTERMFRRLCLRLARLRSPASRDDSFTINIESDEFPQYSGAIRMELLDRSPYRIDAQFDGDSTIRLSVDSAPMAQHRWNGAGPLTCGPVRVRIHAFDLETESIAKIGPRMEVRAWLKEWSGVSLYRDGFRVWPYGEPHDDWLRLDQRRVNNPVVKLSNNQVVGFVEISGDENPELRDQTNREGLINNKALEDLRRLVHHVLQLLEAERQSIRHPEGRNPRVLGGATRKRSGSIPDSLRKLSARVKEDDVAGELVRLAVRAEQEHAAEETEHRRFIEGYSDLAALGQAAVSLQETVQPQLEEMVAACERIAEQARRQSPGGVVSQARAIRKLLDGVASRISLLAPLETGMNRRRRLIDVPSEVAAALDVLSPMLEAADVETSVDGPVDGVLRVEMRPETFGRLFHILVLNSLDWLRGTDERRIRIQVRSEPEYCHILFTDSGPGIPKSIAKKVFEPLFSTKEGGRGMGLTIARDIVTQHGGKIYVDPDQRRKGANIHIELPVKRSRSTLSY